MRVRQLFQISLRSLFLIVTFASFWLGLEVNAARRQGEAVAALENRGWTVRYDFQAAGLKKPQGPAWLQRLLGIDHFANVVSVNSAPDPGILATVRTLFAPKLNPTGDETLAKLEAFPRLKTLELWHIRVSDADLFHLRGLTEITELNIGSAYITGDGLRHLSRLKNLKTFYLEGEFRPGALRALPTFPNLQSLRFFGAADAKDMEGVARSVNLRSLSLQKVPIADGGLQRLSQCKRLNNLDLRASGISDRGLRSLGELKELRKLILDDNAVTDAGIANLRQLNKLEELSLKGSEVTDAAFEVFESLRMLRKLELLWTWATPTRVRQFKWAHPSVAVSWCKKPPWDRVRRSFKQGRAKVEAEPLR